MERENEGVWEKKVKITKDLEARIQVEGDEIHLRLTNTQDGQGIEINMDFLDSSALRRLLEHAEEKILGPDLHERVSETPLEERSA